MLTHVDLGSIPQSGRTTIMTATLSGLQKHGVAALMVKPTVVYAQATRHRLGRLAEFPIADHTTVLNWLEDRQGEPKRIAVGMDDTRMFDTRPIIDELTTLSATGRTIILITAS